MTTRTATTHTFYIGKDDLLPLLQEYLLNDDDTPIDLTNAGTVVLYLWRYDSGTKIVKVDGEAGTFVDRAAGLVQYQWSTGDTDTPGEYQRRWVVTFNASPISVPNDRSDGYPVVIS